MKRVVITGMGVVSTLGHNINDFWENMLKGKMQLNSATRFDSGKYRSKLCACLDYEAIQSDDSLGDYKDFPLLPKLCATALRQALANSGFTDKSQYKNAGISVGTTSGVEIDRSIKLLCTGKSDSREFGDNVLLSHWVNFIAEKFGLQGPKSVMSSACTSGTVSIIYAYHAIANGDAEIMATGGFDALQESAYAGFNSLRVVSQSAACRPFASDRTGIIIGDGAAILILEEYESAVRRGALILAEVKGIGMSCDAHHATAPNSIGAAAAMKMALKTSGLKPEEIQYVNCHGTGTFSNDKAEAQAMSAVFDGAVSQLFATSTKSTLGHLLGTAGSIEAIMTTLILQKNVIPPMVGNGATDDVVKFQLVTGIPKQTHIMNAMSNSFGFGGNNASIIFSKIN